MNRGERFFPYEALRDENLKPKEVKITYDKTRRYMLDILREVGKEFNIQIEEIPLIRSEGETDSSYHRSLERGKWSVKIIPPKEMRGLSEFWRKVKELEGKREKGGRGIKRILSEVFRKH
ncbi:MAG: hypothetical protein N2259_02325 [Patescibacteria group bacterium]|nr:hypothetical protein [Patescibacteria group bacterium]